MATLLWLLGLMVLPTAALPEPGNPGDRSGPRLTLPAEVAGPAYPALATVGVPLPKGISPDAKGWVVTDGRMRFPTQARIQSRWPDGSARWLLVDWIASSAPDPAGLRLEREEPGAPSPGPRSSPAPAALRLTESPQGIEVDTGALHFRVPADSVALVDQLRRAGSPTPGGSLRASAELGGAALQARSTSRVRVLERGPVRVRVESRGSYGAGLDFVLRVDAWAGQDVLRIFHTFEYRGRERRVDLSRLSLDLSLPGLAAKAVEVGRVEAPVRKGNLQEGPLVVRQADERRRYFGATQEEGRLAGWFRLDAATGAVGLRVPFLWQEYPQDLRFTPEGWTHHLWSPAEPPARLGVGVAKTHEFLLSLAPGTEGSGTNGPRLAHVDPSWTAASGAVRNFVAPGPGAGGDFLTALTEGYRRYRAHADREEWDDRGMPDCPRPRPGSTAAPDPFERRRVGFYGMLNWGDWNFRGYHDDVKGCDAWGNLEYDLPQVLALHWLATGSAQAAEGLLASARHFRDVDTIHACPDRPEWTGMNHPKNPLHFSFALGGVDLGHTWTEGLISYSLLTGDERGLEGARGIGDYLVHRVKARFLLGNPRQWGWPQIALVALWEATGESSWREAAAEYARRGMAQHEPDRIGDFKLGILAEGLAYTHSVTGDPAIASWLARYARAVAASGERPDVRLLPALVHASGLAGDPQLASVARQAVARLDFGHWGKPLSIAGRLGFGILGSRPAEPVSMAPAGKRR